MANENLPTREINLTIPIILITSVLFRWYRIFNPRNVLLNDLLNTWSANLLIIVHRSGLLQSQINLIYWWFYLNPFLEQCIFISCRWISHWEKRGRWNPAYRTGAAVLNDPCNGRLFFFHWGKFPIIAEFFPTFFLFPRSEFSHQVGIFPIIFLFLRMEFIALVFKTNCSSVDSNHRPLGSESSTLTPRPSLHILNLDINALNKEHIHMREDWG